MSDLARVAILASMLAAPAAAQQIGDSSFRVPIARPAYSRGAGPRVCMDVAHNTFTSSKRNPGAFVAFERLIADDGYRFADLDAAFTDDALGACDVLVIAEAKATANVEQWWLPNSSAFTDDEIAALDHWVRAGGGLFVITDHIPTPGSAADLGLRVGILALNGMAKQGRDASPDVFARSRSEVAAHAITRGRTLSEAIDSVATFTGNAFLASREWSPLLVFGAGASGVAPFPDVPRGDWPQFSVEGWFQAAARHLAKGRIVWLGEVSTCTAIVRETGMNHPAAGQNAQFCLNIMRWLAGALAD